MTLQSFSGFRTGPEPLAVPLPVPVFELTVPGRVLMDIFPRIRFVGTRTDPGTTLLDSLQMS